MGELFSVKLPEGLYNTRLLTPLGFPYEGFRSSDFFPILPWFFLYLCGYFIHGIFAAHPAWQRPFTHRVPLLSALGRRALLVYLLHQPLCMLVCIIIFELI